MRGVALGLWDPPPYDSAIAEIAALGATHIALVVSWQQRDIRAQRIRPGPETPSDAAVREAVRVAHAAGLKVLVFPILVIERTRPGQWRGTLRPADRDGWWRSYEQFILHYAKIAAAEEASALLIGSELGSTETWRDHWYHLISRVERLYRGRLIYSANWDHYQQVSFWRRLDQIGVTGYFRLTDDQRASTATLATSWKRIRAELVAFARAQGKPLWLTEVGYLSRDGAAIEPWNYVRDTAVDVEEQRRAYRATMAAWSGVAELTGVFFWNWNGAGGLNDEDYTPRGKPAEALLRAWFHHDCSVD